MDVKRARDLAADDPDYSNRDLFNAIANGNYPTWTLYIQVMTFEEAATNKFNPFDITKVWSHADYPLIPVGKLVLNRNPTTKHTQHIKTDSRGIFLIKSFNSVPNLKYNN